MVPAEKIIYVQFFFLEKVYLFVDKNPFADCMDLF